MMDSLLDLKTELYRKTQQMEKRKTEQAADGRSKSSTPLPGSSRDKVKLRKPAVAPEEEADLKLSRKMLEAKASFYDRMTTTGLGSDGSKRYLVDFEQKVLGDAEKVAELKTEHGDEIFDASEQVFEPMHYQHMRESEAREMGVSYFEFSLDEVTRKEQMKMLREMHAETKAKKKEKLATEEKRKGDVNERLNKIRGKFSLAPQEPEPVEVDEQLVSDDEEMSKMEQNIERGVNKQRAAAQKRTWDVAKNKTMAELYDEKVKKSRDDRDPDFAPPNFYDNSNSFSEDRGSISNVAGSGELRHSGNDAMRFLENKQAKRSSFAIPSFMRDDSVLLNKPDYS